MIPLRDNVSSRGFPWVNYGLIAANIYAFYSLLQLSSPLIAEKTILQHAAVPAIFLSDPLGNLDTILTSMFLHGGWMHIIGNMLFLHIFGDNVEDKSGHFGYLVFYISCGFIAAFAQIALSPHSKIPIIGASGAIAGVLGAYLVFFPGARILTLVPLGFFTQMMEVPAYFFLGIWFVLQAFSGTSAYYLSRVLGHDSGGVAWWAHAGGFL